MVKVCPNCGAELVCPNCAKLVCPNCEFDPLASFLDECCVFLPGVTVQAANFYKAYVSWAEAQGFRERERLTSTAFGLKMKHRFTKVTNKKCSIYHGVALVTDTTGGIRLMVQVCPNCGAELVCPNCEFDPLALFLNDCCVLNPDRHCDAAGFYDAYEVWAKAYGIRERERLTPTAFGLKMKHRFTKVDHIYHGVGLADARIIMVRGEGLIEECRVDDFLNDCCVQRPRIIVQVANFYEAYVVWAKAHEKECLSQRAFGVIMRHRFNPRGTLYQGVGLVEDYLPQFLNDCCVLNPGLNSDAASFYDAYVAWAKAHEKECLSQRAFGVKMSYRFGRYLSCPDYEGVAASHQRGLTIS